MIGSRLFWRVYLGTVVLILFTAGVVGFLAGRQFEEDARRKSRENLRTRAILAREIARPAFSPDVAPADESRVAATLGRLAVETGTRFTLIAADGTVLVDTERDPATMENHGDRPEVLAAARDGFGFSSRVSISLRRAMTYAAIPSEEAAGGFVRAAAEARRLDESHERLRPVIALAAAIASLVALLFGGIVVRHFTRPLVEMSRAARAIESGDLDRRIDYRRRDELGAFASAFNRMAGQLRERIVHVTEERNRLSTILSSMVEGVVAVDPDERILHMNRPAAEMLGAGPDPVLGEPLGSITRIVEVREALAETRRQGSESRREVVLSAHPEDRVIDVHVAPILSEGKGRGGAVIVLHDVTEVRRLEAVRRDFVANVSHELKTPLTAIQGFLETLLDDRKATKDTRRRFLAKAAQHTKRVAAIVSDLLTLSRVESGMGMSDPEALDLRELVIEVGRSVVSASEAKGIELTTEVPGEPLEVVGDRGTLRLAIDNLVVNAVKYTPTAGQVRLGLVEEGGFAVVEVADTGIGIEEKHRARLFERFYRVDQARSRELGGTGLGLAIVRHVALAHGGRVGFESTPGEGSVFRLRIPLARASTPPPASRV